MLLRHGRRDIGMSLSNLPGAVSAFLQAVHNRDPAALLATFAADGVLIDGGIEYRGTTIYEWNDHALTKSGAIVHPINFARRAPDAVLTVLIRAEHDITLKRRPKQFDWRFTISDNAISALTILEAAMPPLSVPVASFVEAANAFDVAGLLDSFVDDALVNDQLREYWGKADIGAWAAKSVVGDRLTIYVVKAVEQYGNVVVMATTTREDCLTHSPLRSTFRSITARSLN
jgi:ketosteroid isomerase-like protein